MKNHKVTVLTIVVQDNFVILQRQAVIVLPLKPTQYIFLLPKWNLSSADYWERATLKEAICNLGRKSYYICLTALFRSKFMALVSGQTK